MSVCAAVFLMKHGLSEALLTQYSAYFLMPPLVLFWIFFFVLVMTQIVAFRKGLTPYLKWCCVFSMAFGMLVYFLAALLGNQPLGNALRCAWLAIGNVWIFGGLLVTMKKAQRAYDRGEYLTENRRSDIGKRKKYGREDNERRSAAI